jgi:protein-S-isoprenylcysteine O-methyltransferase Ste14
VETIRVITSAQDGRPGAIKRLYAKLVGTATIHPLVFYTGKVAGYAYMEAQYGQEYRDYREKVRRYV